MPDYDLTSPRGQQDFQNWVNRTIQNEINSYARQVLGISNTGVGNASATSSSGTGSAGDSIIPSGTIFPYAGGVGVTGTTLTDLPEGWILCFGQAISRVAYSTLFKVIGTTYGVGDGSTTFNLPDLRGRVLAGKDDMGGTPQNRLTTAGSGVNGVALNGSGGNQTVTLSLDHVHYGQGQGGSLAAAIGAVNSRVDSIGYIAGGVTSPGSGTATYAIAGSFLGTNATSFNHYTPVYGNTSGMSANTAPVVNTTQPTIIVNYIIKT